MSDECEPTVDELIESCVRYAMDGEGNFVKDEEASRGYDDNKWSLDASRLVQDDNLLAKLVAHLTANAERIYALRINGAKLDVASANRLCATLWNRGLFGNLVDADYAYMRMSFESGSLMCHALDRSVKGGCCRIKRLVLTRMELGYRGTDQLFNALCGNIFIEELVLNGNNCTDAALPALARALRNSQNRFKLLGIGGNDLTVEGMATLSGVLEQHRYLLEFELQGNPLGDEGSDVLFKAIRDNTTLESLNLSNCGLKEVPWAGRLRIMTTLSNLNVSQNLIGDKGCQVLASALEGCFCLRYLDMSHNLFGGRLAMGLGEAIKVNKGLLQLRLSSNPMLIQVWNAIAFGLMHNNTLMRLDLTWCDLDMDAAAKINEALAVNEICDVITDLNPLPDVLRMTPRLYRHKGWPEARPIHPKAAGLSLEAGQAWRSGKIADIQLSKDALAVVKRAELSFDAAADGDDETTGGASAGGGMSISASVNVSPGAYKAKLLAARVQGADEQAQSGFGGKMVLTICYGRPSEVLGTIEVTHFTTYAMSRDLVRPLVKSYLASLGSLSLMGALVENFCVLDPRGLPVQGNEARIRTIWDEAVTTDFTVTLRPGNWIDLPEGEEDDELDEDLEGTVQEPVQTQFDTMRKIEKPWYDDVVPESEKATVIFR